jgi:hypothetical protein
MDKLPVFNPIAFCEARKLSVEKLRSPQVPVLISYVPSSTRGPTVVRNDPSNVFVRSLYKKLYEEVEAKRAEEEAKRKVAPNKISQTIKRIRLEDWE